MKKVYTFILWGYLCGLVWLGGGIPLCEAQMEYLGFHFFQKSDRPMRLNFKLRNNLIIIPLKINALDTLNFVLDTGVGTTLITDPNVRKIFNLECIRKVRVAGSSAGDALEGCVVHIKELRLKHIRALEHTLIILNQDVLHLSEYAGIKIHGLIGHDIFSRFVVEIDYLKQRLTLRPPQHFKPKVRRHVSLIPLSIEQFKPYLTAHVQMNSNQYVPVKLLLDTGAGHSLSLDPNTHPDIKLPPKHINTHLGMTLSGVILGSVARVAGLRLGAYTLERVVTCFPDTASMRYLRSVQRQGNLGYGILKRFHLTINYPHQYLLIRPQTNWRAPFELNTSGIEIIATGEDFDTYIIGSVRSGSPAETAGLLRGDTLVIVDNQLTSQLRMEQINQKLNKKNGEYTTLLIRRNQQLILAEYQANEDI